LDGAAGFAGPKISYKKKTHRHIAARPSIRIGLAIAMVRCCCASNKNYAAGNKLDVAPPLLTPEPGRRLSIVVTVDACLGFQERNASPEAGAFLLTLDGLKILLPKTSTTNANTMAYATKLGALTEELVTLLTSTSVKVSSFVLFLEFSKGEKHLLKCSFNAIRKPGLIET